jgi:hypothetical protein
MLRNFSKLFKRTAGQFSVSDVHGAAGMPLKNKFTTSAVCCIQAVSSVSHRRKPNVMAYALLVNTKNVLVPTNLYDFSLLISCFL